MQTTVTTRLAGESEQWDGLVDRLPVPSPFLRSWWLEAIRDAGSRFVLVHDDTGTLMGGLAVSVSRMFGLEIVRLAGNGVLCADHLDAVRRRGAEDEVARALGRWLRRTGTRVIDADGLVPDSLVARALHVRGETRDIAPCEPLTSAFLDGRPASLRKTVRKAQRRFDALGARTSAVAPERLGDALAAFARLHRARGDRAELLGVLPVLERALAAGVRAGEARVDVLATPDETMAVSIAFTSSGRLSLYQTARSTAPGVDNASTVLHVAVIESARQAGAGELDLLRGAEGYKQRYADGQRSLHRVRVGVGRPARMVLSGLRAAAVLRGRLDSLAAQRATERSSPGRTSFFARA